MIHQLLTSAFDFKLRRYIQAAVLHVMRGTSTGGAGAGGMGVGGAGGTGGAGMTARQVVDAIIQGKHYRITGGARCFFDIHI
jgi:hypothetical protein